MTPRELVTAWVEAFNQADADRLAGVYGHWDKLNYNLPLSHA